MHQDVSTTELETRPRALAARSTTPAPTPAVEPEPTLEPASPADPGAPPHPETESAVSAAAPEPATPPVEPGPEGPESPIAPTEDEESFQRAWWANVQAELASSPELQAERSPLRQAVETLLEQHRCFSLSPEGFSQAVSLARARQAAAALPALQSRLAALAAENARLVGLTSLTGTPPARTRGEEAGRGLSERDLRRLAAELDATTAA